MPVTPQMAKPSERYLVKNDYTDTSDPLHRHITTPKQAGTLAPLPPELAPHATAVFRSSIRVFSNAQLPEIEDDRKAKRTR